MRRGMLTMLALGAIVAVTAAPAVAKEGHGPVEGEVSVSGPGLAVPIHLAYRGPCLYGCLDLHALESDFVGLAFDLQVAGISPAYTRTFAIRPARSELGPAYTVKWVFWQEGRTTRVSQLLYPFAPERPWVLTPDGQGGVGFPLAGGWAPAPPSLLGLLRGHGLPAGPPRAADATGTASAASARAGTRWPILAAGAALLVMLISGSLAGRPRRLALGRGA